MDFVNEQNIATFEVQQMRRDLLRAREISTNHFDQATAHRVGDNSRQRGLAQPRCSGEQEMPNRATFPGGAASENAKDADCLGLSNVFVK